METGKDSGRLIEGERRERRTTLRNELREYERDGMEGRVAEESDGGRGEQEGERRMTRERRLKMI